MTVYVNTGAETSDLAAMLPVTDIHAYRSGAWKRVESIWLNEATATASLASLKPLYLQPETEAHISRMNTTPDNKLAADLNEMITQLKNKDLWDKIDVLSVAHGADAADARLNIRGDEYHASVVGNTATVAYIADVGFLMNRSASAHLQLAGVGESDLSRYAAVGYASHAWVYTRTSIPASVVYPLLTMTDSSGTGRPATMIYWNGSFMSVRFNDNVGNCGGGFAASFTAGANTSGFSGMSWESSNTSALILKVARQAFRQLAGNECAYSKSTKNILIGGGRAGFLDSKVVPGSYGGIGGWGAGSRLDRSELSAMGEVINDFFTRRGTNQY